MLSFLGFTVENNKHHAVLFCVGQEGGLVEDTVDGSSDGGVGAPGGRVGRPAGTSTAAS